MISLETALKLKLAGLGWRPVLYDFFAIPERQMDEEIFVISNMLVTVNVLQGLQVVNFQGASEWALDSLVTIDAVWLPREDQLRQAVEAALLNRGWQDLRLSGGLNGYRLEIKAGSAETKVYQAADASEVYSKALLDLLESQARLPDPSSS